MCPYDAPKYSQRLGIVRKCDMCSHRLAVSEAPACVQGCPNQAIRIKVVEQHVAVQASAAGAFLPGAPAPDHTVPTTVYKSQRPAPANMLPADFYSVSPEHGHPPLVLLLVLTQLAAGAFAGTFAARRLFALPSEGPWALGEAAFALALGLAALGASVFHLGRPLGAWRAFLGLRTSWMSREAVAFGLFAKLGAVYALSLVAGRLPDLPGKALLVALRPAWEAGAATVGLAGVFCSVMIYAATRRTHWRAPVTGAKFFATTALLGAATMLVVARVAAAVTADAAGAAFSPGFARALLLTIAGVSAGKLLFEATVFRHLRGREHTTGKRVAIVMVRDLAGATVLRFAAGVLGGLLLPGLALARGHCGPALAVAVFVLLLAGELAERYLFFKAAPPSRMPGALA
jgi:DMSO reductase anchor subunit